MASSVCSQSTPSYPYPALNVANFVSLQLTSDNYLLWKTQMMALIESQELLGFINGEYEMPNPKVLSNEKEVPNPTYATWRRSNHLLRGWITDTLSKEVLGIAVGLETSLEVWKALEDHFAQSSQDREFHLMQELSSIQKGDDTLNEYIRKFKYICDELSTIGKTISDKNKVYWFLQGLGPSYENFVTTMLKPPISSYKELIPLLKSHESRNSHHQQNAPPPQMAFLTQKSNGRNYYYKKKGNDQRLFSSKGKGFIQTSTNNKSSVGFKLIAGNSGSIEVKASGKDIEKRLDVVCQICNKHGHVALKCFNRFNHAYQANDIPQALAAMTINQNDLAEWYPDTGAKAHMTGNSSKLINLKPYKGNDGVMLGNENINAMDSTYFEARMGPTQSTTISQKPSLTNDDGGHATSCTVNPAIVIGDQIAPNIASIEQQEESKNRPSSRSHPMITRSQWGICKPNPKYVALQVHSKASLIPMEPKSIKLALQHPGWTKAMHEELSTLKENHTWDLVPRTKDMNVIGSKWVFKTKLKSNGSLDRLKARIVAKGFHQIDGVDVFETFSLVIKPSSIRVVLTIAIVKDWGIRQLDVKNAFLHGNLSELVFMEQPLGFIDD
ncbi:hypothetical protein SLEP1_g53748 [Rubroshorea leprosula]|uniref:Reverse transcriptase Ty1/copia-type domain-containing protein n=1 Tax=Rubroshorea leprosula TaxID=152421 RepID=A0AAV5MA82_9ROSI|nr:hypothetical protein SLEP1_g53748 [Rubroshorea leprosula]